MPIIPALRRLRQEDCKFKASLGYGGRLCLKNKIIARHQWFTPVILATQEADRDQEDLSLKPAQANSSRDLISKNPVTKKGAGVSPEFKSHTAINK
jgi:hypothetical protein